MKQSYFTSPLLSCRFKGSILKEYQNTYLVNVTKYAKKDFIRISELNFRVVVSKNNDN